MKGGLVFVSGQLGLDPTATTTTTTTAMKLVDGGAAEQTKRALANVDAVLSCVLAYQRTDVTS